MKKFLFLVLLTVVSTQVVFAADSYLRWIYWDNEKSHVANQTEMAAIIDMIANNKVKPDLVYTLSTGVSFRIPKPDLYLEYLLRCIKKSDPTVVTIQDAVEAVLGGDAVEWGNDISYRVKNYYFSSLNNRIQYIDNYTGVESGTRFLLINGNATIKFDCGNPLEVIGDVVMSKPIVQEETPQTVQQQQTLIPNVERQTVSYRKLIQPVIINKKVWVVPVFVVGGVTFVVGVGYLIYSLIRHHQVIEPRTMPPGIPSVPVVPTPGVPSDSRTMPPGVG